MIGRRGSQEGPRIIGEELFTGVGEFVGVEEPGVGGPTSDQLKRDSRPMAWSEEEESPEGCLVF